MKKSHFLFIFYIFVQWSIFSAGAQTQYTKQLSSDFITLQESDYPVTTDGIPYFAQVFQLDTLCQQKDIAVELLYPEWQPLSIEEKRALAKYNIKVETLKIQHHLSTSRKRSVVEVNFSPIALVKGRAMRLTSAKIQIKISPQLTPSAKRVSANPSAKRWKDNSVLSQGKWIKIRVEKEGIYQLTSSFLKKNGLSDINKVKLYGYGGRPIEENWTFDNNEGTPDDLQEIPLYRKSDGTAL